MIERDERWIEVDPNTIVRAGQPVLIEYELGEVDAYRVQTHSEIVTYGWDQEAKSILTLYKAKRFYVDSTWEYKPDLPTEETHGIVIFKDPLTDPVVVTGFVGSNGDYFAGWKIDKIADFLPIHDPFHAKALDDHYVASTAASDLLDAQQ